MSFADLQPDGVVEHRLDEAAIRHRGSASSDYGRISQANQVLASQSALEAQAAAHWHRIISHAKNQRVESISELMEEYDIQKPRCPECARGNPGGPICRICGRDTTKEQAQEKESEGDAQQPNRARSSSSPLIPRVDWNQSTKTYDRILVERLLDSGSIGGSPTGSASPTPQELYKDVDFRDEDTHMQHILTTLLDSEGLKRSKDRKSYTKKLLKKAGGDSDTDSPAPSSPAGSPGPSQQQQNMPSPLAALRKKKRRKFVGLGLDSDSDDDLGKEDDEEARREESPTDKARREQAESDDDLEEAGDSPEPELPPLNIQLKKRTSDSITICWDISEEIIERLTEVRTKYGKEKMPIYQVQYKPHNTLNANSNPSEIVEKENEKWVVGCKRTKDSGVTVEGLSCNTPYAFRCVRKGWGPWSPTVVIRSGPGAPSAPKLVAAQEVTSTSVLITWQVPEKDNGLPVTDYVVRMKPYGGSFEVVFKGRERCFLTVGLKENTVHIFEVQAGNKSGVGEFSQRLAVRTLPPGAAPMTPWTEAIDEKTDKLYYCHPKTKAVAWTLPKGALVDDASSFRSKRAYLMRCFEKRMQQVCAEQHLLNKNLSISVSRKNLLEDSLRALYGADPDDLDGGLLRIRFDGEDGLDAGGLAKDWFGEVARRLHDGSAGLLRVTDTGFVTIDPRATALHKPSESKWLFKAAGIFLAKALYDNQTLGINLDRVLVKLLCGLEPELDDLRVSEPEFYKGLVWVLENDVTGADLTFTCSYELFGESKVVELVPFGGAKVVDENNKGEYVGLMQTYLTYGRFQPAMGHLLAGFHEHIKTHHLQHFRIEEIQMLLSGRPNIDVGEIQRDHVLAGFEGTSPQIPWLWAVLEDFDQELLCRFVGFFSGCPCLPYEGLSPPLLISADEEGSDSSLPRAHTCFNQLVIPRYSSKEVLGERLIYSLNNHEGGFFLS